MSEVECAHEREMIQTLAERDEAVDTADTLAELIGQLLGLDVGEHSNTNNPWETAATAASAAIAANKFVAARGSE